MAKAKGLHPMTQIKKQLMNYRNTSHPARGKVPAKLVFRKTLRTRLLKKVQISEESELEEAKESDKASQRNTKENIDKKGRLQKRR